MPVTIGADLSGRCDGSYTPQWSGSKLTTALNQRSGPIINNVFFTSIQTVYITSYQGVSPNLINPNDPIPGDNIRDYLIYVNQQNAPNFNERLCIDDTDMNWYFNNWWDTVIPAFKPVGKSFMEVTNFVQEGVIGTVVQHGAYIKYGVGNYSEDPPIVP